MFYTALNKLCLLKVQYISLFLMSFALFSCGGDGEEEGQVLAKVYDKTLTYEDVKGIFPPGTSGEDSLILLKRYTERWIRHAVMLHHAETNLPETKKDVERKLEQHRQSLLIYEMEKEFVKQKLDTTVTEKELRAYYNAHKGDFELKDYIIKVLYVKLRKDDKNVSKVKKWAVSKKQEDLISLDKYASTNAVNYYHDHESWIFLNDLLKEVPLRIDDKAQFLKNNTFVELEDDEYVYFVVFFDYRLKDDVSPFALEKTGIKDRILQTRTFEMMEKLRKELHEKALNESSIENFVGKKQ